MIISDARPLALALLGLVWVVMAGGLIWVGYLVAEWWAERDMWR